METFPFWKKRMSPSSIRVHFPDGVGIGSWVGEIKSDLPAIGRIPNGKHDAVHLRQRMSFASIFVRYHDRVCFPIGVNNVGPIGGPICQERFDIADTVGSSCWQWLHPKFEYGIRADCG